VNDWVCDGTRDKIEEVLSPGLLHPMTRVLLVNAIYFKARWQEPFIEGAQEARALRPAERQQRPGPDDVQRGRFRLRAGPENPRAAAALQRRKPLDDRRGALDDVPCAMTR
jgi:serine protease inhibitor